MPIDRFVCDMHALCHPPSPVATTKQQVWLHFHRCFNLVASSYRTSSPFSTSGSRMAVSLERSFNTNDIHSNKVRNNFFPFFIMLKRWRKITSSRRRARLSSKQQPMTPCSSPVRDVSGQEDCPDPTTIPEDQQQKQQQQQLEENDEPQRIDSPADQLSTHGRVAHAAVELEGLSLDIDAFTRGKSDVVEVVSDDEENKKGTGPEPPASSFDDSEGGSQTSSEESWSSFPSSGSNSTDSNSDAEEEEERSAPGAGAGAGAEASLPSPEASFKLREEFDGGGDDIDGPEPPPGEEFTMGDNDEEDAAYAMDTGPWSSRAIPRWAFLRSSNSLPVLGLGPEDFYHGGSALRHEVSAEDDDDEEEKLDEDGKSSRWSREIAAVGVVYL